MKTARSPHARKPKAPKPIKPPHAYMPKPAKVKALRTYSAKPIGGTIPSIHASFESMKRPGQPVGGKRKRGY